MAWSGCGAVAKRSGLWFSSLDEGDFVCNTNTGILLPFRTQVLHYSCLDSAMQMDEQSEWY